MDDIVVRYHSLVKHTRAGLPCDLSGCCKQQKRPTLNLLFLAVSFEAWLASKRHRPPSFTNVSVNWNSESKGLPQEIPFVCVLPVTTAAKSRSVWRTAFASSLSCADTSSELARNANARTVVGLIIGNVISCRFLSFRSGCATLTTKTEPLWFRYADHYAEEYSKQTAP